MLSIHLPIAELTVDALILLGLGAGVGFLSGLFGVGGGFLVTPLLIFLGVPSAVAAASGANQVIAPSIAAAVSHWRRGSVDFRMGGLMLVGGLAGSAVSVALFALLKRLGQIDLAIALAYVLLLGTVGASMLAESLSAMLRRRRATGQRSRLHHHTWLHGLPLKLRFPKSKLYVSAILPVGIGLVVGVMSGIMGVGGGFLLIPLMIYLLGMPTAVVVGTSLVQVTVVSINVTVLQAMATQSVDIVLGALLMTGGALGAPLGARLSQRLRGDQMRALMAALVLAVAAQLAYGLIATPADLYSAVTPPSFAQTAPGGQK